MRDAAAKAQQATRLMHAGRRLAAAAPTDRQARVFARYVLLHADTARRCLHAWQTDLRGSPTTRPVAARADTPLKHLRREFAKHKDARDKLATRRQAMRNGRAEDLRATAKMWGTISSSGVTALCNHATKACHALGESVGLDGHIDNDAIAAAARALAATALDPRRVYLDVTSYAAGEPNMLSVASGGPAGRRVMQINDVHDHLEELNALRDVAHRTDDLGLVLRAGLVVEICALLELAFGPPPNAKAPRDGGCLLDLIDRDRGESGYDCLVRLRDDVLDVAPRATLRELRDRVGAHMDENLGLQEVVDTLCEIDVENYLGLADTVLDHLDAAATSHVDLGLLAVGHREFGGLLPALSRTTPPAFAPAELPTSSTRLPSP
jgi:hypothetical protein